MSMNECKFRVFQYEDGYAFFICNHKNCCDKDKICFSRLEVIFKMTKNNPSDCPLDNADRWDFKKKEGE